MANDFNYEQSFAKIIGVNSLKTDICAAASRISTTNGTALSLFDKSIDNSNNEKLIKAVLSSGHQSIMEHCYYNIAFNNVSVFVEQFIIEYRLASFTVQSRRYVDFRNVGFYTISSVQSDVKDEYNHHMQELFNAYGELLDMGIPKEDARFILPYCFHSNFYCSCNARELLHIICSMVYGRGSEFTELYTLGKQLEEQYMQFFPGEIEKHKNEYAYEKKETKNWLEIIKKMNRFPEPQFVTSKVEILSHSTFNEDALIKLTKYNFASAYDASVKVSSTIKNIILSTRSREPEFINIAYLIKDISLSAITHFVRHRMQSVLIPCVGNVFVNNHYVLPDSINSNPEAKEKYISLIKNHTMYIEKMLNKGLAIEELVYFALSGNTLDITSSMNARELIHFIKLRACNRAQWEIREIANEMLNAAKGIYPSVFSGAGPTCVLKGYCPEGKKSCGRLANKNDSKQVNIQNSEGGQL